MEAIKKFFKGEEGQGLAEYALILVLVALAVIAVMALLGTAISDTFQRVIDAL